MERRTASFFRIHTFLTILLLAISANALSNQNLTYQGRIIKPDGLPLESASVTFTMSLYSPAPNSCLLYSETQVLDMTGTKGTFNISIGTAAAGLQGTSTGFNQIFINNPAYSITGLTCAVGTSYTPALTDDRSLIVQINDGSAASFTLNPVPIKSVPYALQASQVSGWGINNLVKVSVTGDSTTFSTGEMANLKVIGAAACADGEVLRWNGSTSMWVCSPASSTLPNTSYGTFGLVSIDTSAAVSGLDVAAGVLKLATSGVTGGTFGSPTTVPIVTVDAFGRVTAASSATISGVSPIGSALANGNIWVGNSGVAVEVAVSGDVTLGSTGQILLNASGVAAGTYRSVEVDAKGLVRAGSNPTTLAGYGITDAVKNMGDAPSVASGAEGSIPVPATAGTGAIYFATDSFRIFRNSGTIWELYGTINASDITTGTLSANLLPIVPINKGGTGISTAPTATQVLVGNASGGYDLRTVVGSGGINIGTSSAGILNIDAAGVNPVGSALGSGSFWLGNSAGTAAVVGASGDVLLSNTGSFSVVSIQGVPVDPAAPTADGQVLRYKLTAGSYQASYLHPSDIYSSTSGTLAFPSCTSSETWHYNAVGDYYDCAAISVTGANFGSQAQNSVFAAPATGGAGTASFRTLVAADLPANIIYDGGNSVVADMRIGSGTGSVQALDVVTSGTSRMNIAAGGNIGIGTSANGTANVTLDVAGAVRVGTDTATPATMCSATTTGAIIYNGTTISFCNGTAWQNLGVAGTGVQSVGGNSANNIILETSTADINITNLGGSATSGTLNITLGTVSIGRGGTGLSTAPAALQVLVGNTAGTYDLRTVAGAGGISIGTTSAGTLTISASGVSPTGSALGSGSFWLGDTTGTAAVVAMSGDATMDNTGVITLGTVPVSKGGTGVTSQTGNSLMVAGSAGTSIVSLGTMSDGQILIGANGSAPVMGTLGASNGLSVTTGSGTLAITSNGTPNNVASTLVMRDSTGNISTGTINLDNGLFAGFFGSVSVSAPVGTYSNYSFVLPSTAGSTGQFLTSAAGGELTWSSPAGQPDASYSTKGLVQGLTDEATSGIRVAAGTISLGTSGVTAGSYGDATHISQVTVDGFGRVTAASSVLISGVSPVGSSLAQDNIWIGVTGGSAMPSGVVGDISLTAGTFTVDKIKNTPVSATTPTSSQFLVVSNGTYTPTSMSGDATIASTGVLTLGTVSVTKGGTGLSTAPGALQMLLGTSSGTYDLRTIAGAGGISIGTTSSGTLTISASGVSPTGSALGSGSFWLGDTTGTAAVVAMSGDATMDNTGVITLGTVPVSKGGTGVTSQTGNSLMVAGSAGTSIVSLGTMSNGQIVIGSDGAAPVLGSLGVGSGIVVNSGPGTLTVGLGTSGVLGGVYGDGTHISQVTVDTFGRVTGATNVLISGVSPVGSTLNPDNIWIGSSGTSAVATAVTGDISLTNGTFTVDKIKNTPVSGVAPVASGQVLRFDLTTGSYVASYLHPSDIYSSTSGTLAFPSCAASETWSYNAVGDYYQCVSISVSGANFGSQAQNTVFAAPSTGGAGTASFRTLVAADLPTNVVYDGGNSTSSAMRVGSGTGSVQAVNLMTSGTTRINISSSGNVGVGTSANATANVALDVAGAVRVGTDSATPTTVCSATTTGAILYNGTTISFCNGTSWQNLGVAGAGIQSIGGNSANNVSLQSSTSEINIANLGGSATAGTLDITLGTVSVGKGGTGLSTAPAALQMLVGTSSGTYDLRTVAGAGGISIGTTSAGTLTISATGVSPVGSSLAQDNIWIGVTGGSAMPSAVVGDISLAAGTFTVDKIKNTPVSATTPTSSQFLVVNNGTYTPTSMSGDATIASTGVLTLGTVSVTKGGTGLSTAPAALQMLLGTSSGTYDLRTVAGAGGITIGTTSAGTLLISASAVSPTGSALGSGSFWLGDTTGTAAVVAMSGDATMDNTGAITLNTVSVSKGGTGVTSQTGNSLMVAGSAGTSIVSLGTMSDGQILIGANGSAPVMGTLGASNGLSVTTGSGTLAITSNGTPSNVASTLVMRDSTGNISTGTINLDNGVFAGFMGSVSLSAPAGTYLNYSFILPSSAGSTGQFLTSAAGGELTWSSPAGQPDASYSTKGLVQGLTSEAVSGLKIASGTISLGTSGVTAGVYGDATHISQVTVDAFGRVTVGSSVLITGVSPVGSSLAQDNIWIGVTGGSAMPSAVVGDISLAAGTFTVDKIKNTPVSATTPTSSQFLVVNNGTYTPTSMSGDATIASTGVLTLGTVSVTKGGTGLSTAPAALQMLLGTSSGTYDLRTVAGAGGITIGTTSAGTLLISASAVSPTGSALGSGSFWLGDTTGTAAVVAMSGDATMDNTGAITLNTVSVSKGGTGVTSQTGNSLMVAGSAGTSIVSLGTMSDGQILIGANGSAPVMGTLGASNGLSVTTGSGTLAITSNGTPSNVASTLVMRDSTGNISTGTINLDNGVFAGFMGSVSFSAPAGTYLNYSFILPSSAGSTGQFLTSAAGGELTWSSPAGQPDASYSTKGLVQGLTSEAVSGLKIASGTISLGTSGVTAGVYGDATHISQVTVDAFGRVTVGSSVLITGVSPVGSSLAQDNIWIGVTGGSAMPSAVVGDISLAAGTFTVDKIKNTPVSATTPTSSQFLVVNNGTYTPTSMSGDATIASTGVLTLGTVSVTKGGTGLSTAPAALQMLLGTSSGTYDLRTVAGAGGITIGTTSAGTLLISASAVSPTGSALGSGSFWLGDTTGTAAVVAMSGDATMDNTGAITLNTVSVSKGGTGVTSQTGNSLMVAGSAGTSIVSLGTMSDGQILIGANGSAPVMGTLGASNGLSVTTGSGTLAITSNGTPNNVASTLVMRDSTGNISTGTINLDNGLFAGFLGSVSLSAPAGTYLNYSFILPSSAGSTGQFLTSAAGGELTWSSPAAQPSASYATQGLIQGLTSEAVSGLKIASGTISLGTSGVTAGVYGDATHISQVTVDAFGRVTVGSSVLITGVSPVGSSLAQDNIWIGVTGGSAMPSAVVGDISLAAGTFTVDKIKNTPVSATTPTSSQFLVVNNGTYTPTSMSGDATIASTGVLTLGTVSVTKGGTGLATAPSDLQMLLGTSSGTYDLRTIAGAGGITIGTTTAGTLLISASAVSPTGSALGTGSFWLGDNGGIAAVVSMSGDATMASTGVITLGTVSVSKGGTGLNTVSNNGMLYGAGTSAMNVLSIGTPNQFMGVSSGTAPAWLTLGGDVSVGSITNGTFNVNVGKIAGYPINITSPQNNDFLKITNGTWVNTGTLSVSQGGTGLSSGTAGGIPWFNSTTTLQTSGLLTQFGVMIGGGASSAPSTLAAMTNGQILIGATGTAPTVGTLAQSNGIIITNGSGAITVATDGTFSATASTLVRRDVAGGFQGSGSFEMVLGQIYADEYAVPGAGTTVDFQKGNVQYLNTSNFAGTAITLTNMKGGASYTVVIKDGAGAARTFTFTNCTTSKFVPANGATTAGSDTVYSILYLSSAVAGSNTCYISWITGF